MAAPYPFLFAIPIASLLAICFKGSNSKTLAPRAHVPAARLGLPSHRCTSLRSCPGFTLRTAGRAVSGAGGEGPAAGGGTGAWGRALSALGAVAAGGRATLSLSRKGPACVLGARPASGPWLCKHFLPLRGLSLHFLDSMNAILKPSNTERRIPRLPLILRVSRKDVGSDPKSETTPCGLGQVSSPSGPPFPVVGGPSAWWRWNVNSACQQTGQEDTAWPADTLGGRQGRRCSEGPP